MSILLADVPDAEVALIAATGEIASYGDLRRTAAALDSDSHSLAFLRAENTIAAVTAYVACVEAGVPVLLIDRDVSEATLASLVGHYHPDLLLNIEGLGGEGAEQKDPEGFAPWAESPFQVPAAKATRQTVTHPDLAVLLSTSGSTGTPKLVRLSQENIVSNAVSIAEGLGITAEHRAISSLPYSYTYGLSVINSHLLQGASLMLTDAAVVAKDFWDAVDEHAVTSIAGVPSSYKMLRQMRWDPQQHSTLRYATQAGGRLNDDDRRYFLDLLGAAGAKFFVMYGQTEATARMTITQPEELDQHISTAGRAVAGGRLEVSGDDGSGSGEIIYHGPNVMLGYAENSSDLARGDDMGGTLHTGDLGYLQDGLLFLTGRSKRIVKVFGKRVSLDDVDRWLAERLEAVAVQGEDRVVVVAVGPEEADRQVRSDLATYLGVHPTGVSLARVDALPLLSSGKVDLQTLREMVT